MRLFTLLAPSINFCDMKHTRMTVIAGMTAVAALAAGCASSDEPDLPAPPPSAASSSPTADAASGDGGAVTETVTERATADGNGQEAAGTGGNDGNGETPKEGCAALPNDPREQYPSGSAPGRMPQAGDNPDDYQYWIEDVENAYDPCAAICWIIFRGSLGDSKGPAGTGASIADGIAFYVHGKPITQMKLFDAMEEVHRIDEENLSFSWGERGETTAAGITDHYTVTLKAKDGTLVPVDGDTEKFLERWNLPEKYVLGHGN